MSDVSARYVTVADAAAYLGCDSKTIRRAIEAGKLQAFRLGARSIRLDRLALDEFMVPIPAGGVR